MVTVESMQPTIFLSHSKKDSDFIHKIARLLQSSGIKVWLDDIELLPGQSLSKKIFEAIPTNEVFFLYLTKHSLGSAWVEEELESALTLVREGREDFVALFVDSEETRKALPVNLRRLYSPVLNETTFYEPLLKLINKVWLEVSRKHEQSYKNEARKICYKIFKKTNDEYESFFLNELSNAREEVILFGLGRQFYRRSPVQSLLRKKALEIPIHIFMMNPYSEARRIRYASEPIISDYSEGANLHEPENFIEGVLLPLTNLKREVDSLLSEEQHSRGLNIKLHEFSLTFAFEKIDEKVIVMHYGYGKRGSDSPVFVFDRNCQSYSYFEETADWIKSMSQIGKIMDITDFTRK